MTRSRPDLRRIAQARRAATQRAVVDATVELLGDRPFRELTIADVMAAAGLTRTAFYRYFPDLESVLLQRLAEVNVELEAASDLWLSDSADPRGSLLEAAVAFAEAFSAEGRLILAFADAAVGAPELEAVWRDLVDGFTGRIVARIEGLCRDGLSGVEDAAETARALVLMTERYLLETYGRGRSVPVERAARTMAFIWDQALFGDVSSESPANAAVPPPPAPAWTPSLLRGGISDGSEGADPDSPAGLPATALNHPVFSPVWPCRTVGSRPAATGDRRR